MTEKLMELLRREPFIAINIVMDSGQNYHVESPWQVAIGPKLVHYLYPKSDAEAQLRVDAISSVEQFEVSGT